MVQPVACHTPSLPPAADALPAASLGEVPRPAPALLSSVASCHARTAAPVRDRLFAASAAAAAAVAEAPAPPAPTARAATSAGYAESVASAVSTVVQAAAKTKTTTATTAKKKSTGALAFLDDKALSTSDKLMRLLVYLESKWQKDVEKRMKEIAATGTAKKSSSSSSSSSASGGGLLGTVVKSVASFVPGADGALALLQDTQARQLISQVSGPALAAGVSACGFPELAPMALKLGPTAVKALASATKPAKAAATSSTRSSSASSSDLSPDAFEKIQLMELQRVVDHQKELFSMVSNMLRAESELRMTIIQNVR